MTDLAKQLIQEVYTPRSKKRQHGMTPTDQLNSKYAKLARQVLKDPKKFGAKLHGDDILLPKTGELIFIKGEGWAETQLKWYLEDGEFYQ